MNEKKKRLDIRIVGHDWIYCEQNTKKEKPNQPDYVGNGVAVWVREVKPKVPQETKVEDVGFHSA